MTLNGTTALHVLVGLSRHEVRVAREVCAMESISVLKIALKTRLQRTGFLAGFTATLPALCSATTNDARTSRRRIASPRD